jgi:hypothetical protein
MKCSDMAVLRGSERIQNAKDFFDFVDNKLRIPQSGIYKRPVYPYDEEIPGDKILDYKPGNRKFSSDLILRGYDLHHPCSISSCIGLNRHQ